MIARHDEIRDELAYLLKLAFPPSAIRSKPRIFQQKPVKKVRDGATEEEKADAQEEFEAEAAKAPRGDISARGFWRRQTNCVVDVRLTDTDQRTWRGRSVEKAILAQEREKKEKYLSDCQAARMDFTPFVVSVDGVLGREASMFLKRLTQHLAGRWEAAPSQIANYINTKMSISVLRATHQCLRGSRLKVNTWGRGIGEDGASLGLYRMAQD